MPWDVTAQNDEAGAQRTYGRTIAGLDAGWALQQQHYGLGVANPYSKEALAANPYSEAARISREGAAAQRGATTGSGLGLYSGSTVNRRALADRRLTQARNDLQNAFQSDHIKYQQDRAGADDALNEARSQAGWDRVQAGLEAGPTPAPLGRRRRRGRRRMGVGRGRVAH